MCQARILEATDTTLLNPRISVRDLFGLLRTSFRLTGLEGFDLSFQPDDLLLADVGYTSPPSDPKLLKAYIAYIRDVSRHSLQICSDVPGELFITTDSWGEPQPPFLIAGHGVEHDTVNELVSQLVLPSQRIRMPIHARGITKPLSAVNSRVRIAIAAKYMLPNALLPPPGSLLKCLRTAINTFNTRSFLMYPEATMVGTI